MTVAPQRRITPFDTCNPFRLAAALSPAPGRRAAGFFLATPLQLVTGRDLGDVVMFVPLRVVGVAAAWGGFLLSRNALRRRTP